MYENRLKNSNAGVVQALSMSQPSLFDFLKANLEARHHMYGDIMHVVRVTLEIMETQQQTDRLFL